MNCSGTAGNPALKPYTNINRAVPAEWYVNRDTMLTASAFRQVGIIGAAHKVQVYNARPFEGTGETAPAGHSLSDVGFKYTTCVNGPAVTRTGIDLGAKTAFAFLPSVLRFTGASANYTKVRATSLEPKEIDFHSGEVLPQRGVQSCSWNASLQVTPATLASGQPMLDTLNYGGARYLVGAVFRN